MQRSTRLFSLVLLLVSAHAINHHGNHGINHHDKHVGDLKAAMALLARDIDRLLEETPLSGGYQQPEFAAWDEHGVPLGAPTSGGYQQENFATWDDDGAPPLPSGASFMTDPGSSPGGFGSATSRGGRRISHGYDVDSSIATQLGSVAEATSGWISITPAQLGFAIDRVAALIGSETDALDDEQRANLEALNNIRENEKAMALIAEAVNENNWAKFRAVMFDIGVPIPEDMEDNGSVFNAIADYVWMNTKYALFSGGLTVAKVKALLLGVAGTMHMHWIAAAICVSIFVSIVYSATGLDRTIDRWVHGNRYFTSKATRTTACEACLDRILNYWSTYMPARSKNYIDSSSYINFMCGPNRCTYGPLPAIPTVEFRSWFFEVAPTQKPPITFLDSEPDPEFWGLTPEQYRVEQYKYKVSLEED